ncbi:HAMP domain-containing sensor histidine kinase [Tenggerimyces flavus]|uniref:histidine kinase n=1 Tax=Tenggerimyces flavus TaxID=1708749 RepID=A0ABV7YD32_9ACTN|nr:HAMP domain-containing sensor histidine kinase [Tenggerimyces flavus]MBM7788152.1 signal transduction histidine kinase [Tenggerimyces flavus]
MRLPILGLRGRVILAFGLGATTITAAFAVLTYVLAQNYLVEQRQRSSLRQAYTDATLVRDQLETNGVGAADAIAKLAPPTSTSIVLYWQGDWYASSLEAGRDAVPTQIRRLVADGKVVTQRVDQDGDTPELVIGLPLPAVDAELYEISTMEQLDETLAVLGTVLIVGAVVAALGGVALGIWASRSVIQPLDRVAATAAQIAAGQLGSRLPATRDPGLATIVGSFNSMAETLQQRLQRDARLAADVSHELRSPLTTLMAAVEVMNKRREELPPRSQEALGLVTEELGRFERLMRNLLDLARADAGLDPADTEQLPLTELVRHTLSNTGRSAALLNVTTSEPTIVRGDRARLDRVLTNLLDNADRHGGGATAVTVSTTADRVLVDVDDDGPGVAEADRERIFERFATGVARYSSSGTGLGLALATETVGAHGGTIWCTTPPSGNGARFTFALPRSAS